MNKAKASKFRRASTKNDILIKQHIRDSLREEGEEDLLREPALHFVDVIDLNGTSGGKGHLNVDGRGEIFEHDEVERQLYLFLKIKVILQVLVSMRSLRDMHQNTKDGKDDYGTI